MTSGMATSILNFFNSIFDTLRPGAHFVFSFTLFVFQHFAVQGDYDELDVGSSEVNANRIVQFGFISSAQLRELSLKLPFSISGRLCEVIEN